MLEQKKGGNNIKNSIFSERLKSSRKDNGLSQKDLAIKTGVSQVVISSYETNNSEPKICHLSKLAEVLNVSCDYLLGITLEHDKNDNSELKENIRILISRLEMMYREFQNILDMKFKEILNEIEKL